MDPNDLKFKPAQTAFKLRQQLAQMSAASQMLARNTQNDKSRKYLGLMNQSICQMLRIVGRMELMELLGPNQTAKREALNLGRLIAETGAQLEGLLAQTGVRLTVEGPEYLFACADEGLLRQMLLELIVNAAKVGTEVELKLARAGDRAVFTVTDNGAGVPEETLVKLFAEDSGQTPVWEKKGDGIALVRRIAALHDGTLMAECRPEGGLRVSVMISLGQEQTGTMHSPKLSWDSGGFREELVALSDLLPLEIFCNVWEEQG